MSEKQITPEVTWAQRSSSLDPDRNIIYLTIMVPDVDKSSLKLDLQSSSLTFTGYSQTKKVTYHLDLQFYAEIDVDQSKTHHSARDVEMVLRKKEAKDEYWPRLLKDSKKMHFLKTDFDKWVDEDEQDTAPDDDLGSFGGAGGGMGGMEGMGGMGGMPGMEGLGGMGGMGGMQDMLAKLGGGAGGMGGMPDMGDMGEMGGDDDDNDDDDAADEDMPALEDESTKTATAKSSSASAATIPKVEEMSDAAASGETGASSTKTTAAGGKIQEL